MPKNKKNSAVQNEDVLSARVSTELYKAIVELSRKKDLTVTQVVRAAMREYIERNVHAA